MTSLSPRLRARPRPPLAERRVMVFPAATEIALEAHRALGGRRDVVLSSAGVDGPTHAPLVFASHHAVPHVADPGWLRSMSEAVASEGVDYVLPAQDDAVVQLLEAEDALGVTVLAPPLAAALTARSKRATYAALEGVVRVPEILDGPIGPERFPVFRKPDAAQGSLGAEPAADEEAVTRLRARGSDLVTELLPGEELTVDCLSAAGGRLLFAGPRRRERTRAGISMRSTPVEDEALVEKAGEVSAALGMRAAWFPQAKRDALGAPVFMEVGARIAGAG
jgi:carbamoyl-phosphate synthase large subunit